MADVNEIDEDGEEGEDDEDIAAGLEKKRFSGKKLVLFGGIGFVVVLLGAGAAFYFLGGEEHEGEGDGEAASENGEPAVPALVFYDLPEMLVNLNAGGRKPSYLKVQISLEVDDAASIPDIEQKLPRVIDNFQVYLRELRVEDLDGSAGMFRLKEELLRRVNLSVAPAQVNDILFKEMLIQ